MRSRIYITICELTISRRWFSWLWCFECHVRIAHHLVSRSRALIPVSGWGSAFEPAYHEKKHVVLINTFHIASTKYMCCRETPDDQFNITHPSFREAKSRDSLGFIRRSTSCVYCKLFLRV